MSRSTICAFTLTLFSVLALFPLAAAAQEWREFPEVDVTVNGVVLGMPYAGVRQRLGEAESEHLESVAAGTCRPAHASLTLAYPGLKVVLRGTPAGQDFRVVSVEVTAGSWEVDPGLRVGQDVGEVRSLLGEPGWEMADGGRRGMMYATRGKTGVAALTFRGNGDLHKIELESPPCVKPPAAKAARRQRG